MQTCSICQNLSQDQATFCEYCNADLSEYSISAITKKVYIANPRVDYVRLLSYDNCCPACLQAQGSYSKDEIPHLPVKGCSSPNGCRCFYQPFLNDL